MMGTIRVDARAEHIGPGYWKALHQWAHVHDTSTIAGAREMFIDNIVRGTGGHFECLDCRTHALEYMTSKDPIRDILKFPKMGPDGNTPLKICSAWTYRFHEAVNQRLKKPASQRPTFSQHEQYLSDLREGKGCHNCGPIGSIPDVVPRLSRVVHRRIID